MTAPSKHFRHVRGFTLFEMSIVMAVIALIVGGTLVGQSLIRQSQIKSMLGEYDVYIKAIREFREKYQAMPGDYATATSTWSTASNGDGDGLVGNSNKAGTLVNTAGSVANSKEWYMLWHHLSLADFITGRFDGLQITSANNAVVGSNVPASKLVPGGWTFFYFLNTDADTNIWIDHYGHVMTFGANNSGTYTSGAVITPTEMYTMDQKLDDGLPGTGTIRSMRTSVAANCTTNDSSQTAATYNSSGTYADIKACWPMFLTNL